MSGARRILLIDDDATLLEMLSEQLRSQDEFSPETADTAALGIEMAKAEHFDVIILDIGLPDMDGREACRLLRSAGIKCPIIMLTGVDTEADTVLGLRTNRRFVEAYMVGLNHEMGRELLWRGYPTDQRGTYFDHFWGLGAPNAAPRDINDLVTWKSRSLGSSAGAPTLAEQFVMVLRSSLLGRYPSAAIYLTPAIHPGTPPDPRRLVPDEKPEHETLPLFIGALQPDLAFFGFPVSTAAATGADGEPGFYVVIQEHPTEPRFGVDADFPHGSASHLVIGAGATAGRNAAEMAALTRRVPVRMAIHAARLITHA